MRVTTVSGSRAHRHEEPRRPGESGTHPEPDRDDPARDPDRGPSGTASGIGSWPGTDIVEATRISFGELAAPHVPYLPELPARGPGADLVGRGAGLLVDLPVDLQPSGWRLVERPGRDLERARSWLRQDLDVLAEVADGYTGPLKVQVAGPWTLAATLWLPRLERALVDAGACRDLVDSLAEGLRQHVTQLRRLVPGAAVRVQLDEPGLTAVLSGALPTASGLGRLRALAAPVVEEGLRRVIGAVREAGADEVLVHSCAADVPVSLLVGAGADGLSLDVTRLGNDGWEAVAAAVEAGVRLWAGVVPTAATAPAPGATGLGPRPAPTSDLPGDVAVADALWRPWRTLGLPPRSLDRVVLTPTCGLAGGNPARARAVLRRVREGAAALAERAAG